MTDSVYIRLAGPLQSWATLAITGNIVQTERIPTRSGLLGLIAGAYGFERDNVPTWTEEIDLSIRVDRKGQITDDYHTINPRSEEQEFRRRILLSQGRRARSEKSLVFTPDAGGGTSIVKRTYVADAEFLIRITHPSRTEEIGRVLTAPRFSTYLGRKAFPATFPFYLGTGSTELFSKIPVFQREVEKDHGKVRVYPKPPGVVLGYSTMAVPLEGDRSSWLKRVKNLFSSDI